MSDPIFVWGNWDTVRKRWRKFVKKIISQVLNIVESDVPVETPNQDFRDTLGY